MDVKLDYRIEDRINPHIIGGVVLLVTGIIAMAFPWLFSRILIYIVGGVLIFAGLIFGFLYFTTLGESKALLAKSLVFLVLGLISVISPVCGLKLFTVVLMLFFLSAGVTSFMLARSIRSQKGEGMAIFVGVLSILVDVFIIMNWEDASQYMIGLFLGMILFLEGLMFLMVGSKINKNIWME